MHDLTDLARRDIDQVVVHDARLHVEHRSPAGAGLAQLVVRPEHGGQRRNLGLPVQIPQAHARQARRQLAQHLDRHDRRAVVALGQAGEPAWVEQRRAQQRDPHRGRSEETRDAELLHQVEQVVGNRPGRDDVGAADKDAGAEEHVELRAVVQRQRVQRDVAGGNFGVGDAADVLPEHGVVRQHGALGARFGAARVADLQQVRAVELDLGQGRRAAGQLVKAVHGLRRLARLLGRNPDEFAHLGLQRGRGPGQFGQAAVGGQEARSRVAQDESHLVGLEHEVDRHQHRTEARQRKAQRGKAVRVARQNGDALALRHAELREPGSEPRDHRVELRVTPFGVPADDGLLAREAQRRAAQQVAQGLSADRVVHGLLLALWLCMAPAHCHPRRLTVRLCTARPIRPWLSYSADSAIPEPFGPRWVRASRHIHSPRGRRSRCTLRSELTKL